MKKYLLDLRLNENKMLSSDYFLLKLTSDERLPDMKPGQFVEVRVEGRVNRTLSVLYKNCNHFEQTGFYRHI